MPMTLKQIRYFVAAAETGQVSLAAIEMNISQSAVTTAVQSLETELGVKLLERTRAGVVLTLEGSRFLARAHNILATLEDAIRTPLVEPSPPIGVLRIGTTYTVSGYFLPRYYLRFLRTHPGLKIELREMDRVDLEKALICGDLDMALMLVSNLRHAAEIETELLVRSRRRLWLPVDHPLVHATRVSLADVGDQPYIMLTVDEADETQQRYWSDAGVAPEIVFSTSSIESVRSMVAAGAGVTILSDMVYRPWSLEGQRLEKRALTQAVPSMDVGLAWRRDNEPKGAARLFQNFMRLATGGSSGA